MDPRKTAVVVDDDLGVSQFVGHVCKEAGFLVNFASDVESGLELLKGGPTIVIVDLRLASESGIVIVQRAAGLVPRPTIVAISGAGAPALKEAATAGADGTLNKPFSASRLRSLLDELLS